MADINTYSPRSGNVIRSDNTVVNEADGINADGSRNTVLVGSTLAEQLTQADAVTGTLTFSANINTIEIYNRDATNAGVFTVNGITIIVPASQVYKSGIGGTAGATVTVTGSTAYIISRYT